MRPIIDHVSINVTDYERSKAFYSAALAPLGIQLVMEFGQAAGFGRGRKPELWIGAGNTSFQSDEQTRVITPVHVALIAQNRGEVDAFHRAAVAALGKNFGDPGPRTEYHKGYYGAFVLDPDGHNIEAVFHDWELAKS